MLSRMRRPRNFWAWTLTLTAALLAVVWVGSMRAAGFVRVPPWIVLYWQQGCAIVQWPDPASPSVPIAFCSRTDQWRVIWRFSLRRDAMSPAIWTTVLIPLWPFILLTGVPGMWMRIKSRRRTNPNACPACGYDLTGLPAGGGGACPECGASRVGGRIC